MARAGHDLVLRGGQRQRVLIYQSFGGDYYALCDDICRRAVRKYLRDPSRQQPSGHDDAPFCCWWCGAAIDPATWGEAISLTES